MFDLLCGNEDSPSFQRVLNALAASRMACFLPAAGPRWNIGVCLFASPHTGVPEILDKAAKYLLCNF